MIWPLPKNTGPWTPGRKAPPRLGTHRPTHRHTAQGALAVAWPLRKNLRMGGGPVAGPRAARVSPPPLPLRLDRLAARRAAGPRQITARSSPGCGGRGPPGTYRDLFANASHVQNCPLFPSVAPHCCPRTAPGGPEAASWACEAQRLDPRHSRASVAPFPHPPARRARSPGLGRRWSS